MSDRAERIAKLFDEAVELPPERRAAFLDQTCGADVATRRDVETLLRADDGSSAFLEAPSNEAARKLVDASARAPLVGRELGAYRIIDVLGEGGMSIVYRAEQEHPRRTVALKVLKPGAASPSMLRRFEHESQILARLQHPGIAQVYEAGTATIGTDTQPFFAMELIQGERLNQFAESHNLGTKERLSLLARVCEAVQHAHQKSVIHRDLKPANILVDQTGQPKVLDFGVARLTDADIQTTSLRTGVGQLIGTIPYMSPEQVAGDPAQLDTRSDIYALGVVGYELLAGRLPYELRDRMIHEAARVIREDDPTPLSSVNRVFRGDIETIIAKALEKEPERRYQSASDLAADLERYLRDEPIVARRPSALYQFSKFARRNTVLVGGALAAVALLVLGIAGTSWQAIRATRAEADARKLAESEAAQKVKAQRGEEMANAATEFLQDMLASADPTHGDKDVTVLEVLDEAAAHIATDFRDQPEVEAAVRETIGATYRALGEFEQAEVHLRASLALRREGYAADAPEIASCLQNLAEVLREVGEFAEAQTLYQEALEILRGQFGESHELVAPVLNGLALLAQARGEYEQAESDFREALAINREVHGEHETTALALINLASLLQDQRKYEEAESLYREALEINRTVRGAEHVEVALNLDNLATLLWDMGNHEDGERMHREALKMRRKLLPADHPLIAFSLNNVGYVLREQEQYAEAEAMYREALDIRRAKLGDDHHLVAVSLNNLADVLLAQDKPEQAEPLFGEAVAIAERVLPADHPYTAFFQGNFASCLVKLGRFDEAEQPLRRSYERLRVMFGDDDPRVRRKLENLIEVYEATGRSDEAAEWRAKLAPAGD